MRIPGIAMDVETEGTETMEAEQVMFTRTKPSNSSEGEKNPRVSYRCSGCNDTGWVGYWENGYEFVRECPVCKKREYERNHVKLQFANIPEEFKGQTITNFRLDVYSKGANYELATAAKEIALGYVDRFSQISDMGKGLYLYSSEKGSGKTRMAVSIANDLMSRGVRVKFTTTAQLLDEIKATWGDNDTTERQLIHDIVSVPVLVLDDIGVEGGKDWVNERFYNILNGRMIEKHVTIFTSNCEPKRLRLDGRIVNRIEKMALPVKFPDESVRSKLADSENDSLLQMLLGAG